MTIVSDAGEAAERVAGTLEAAGLPYAIGGALAMGVHGYPRGTLDVDVFRGKDRVDLERFVAARAGRLDHAYIRTWMVDMMGEDDERVVAWDRLVERFGNG